MNKKTNTLQKHISIEKTNSTTDSHNKHKQQQNNKQNKLPIKAASFKLNIQIC